MTDAGVNAHLVGVPGGRWRLNTPSVIVDLDLLEANIAKMARLCAESGIALRPHAKTHKSIEIARRQLGAGAIGICCAKLGEAEILAGGGIESILLTSPVVSAEGCRRLAALNRRCPELMVVADCAPNVAMLADAAADSGKPLKVILDLDVGQHRTGIAPGDGAVALAARIAAAPGLGLAGIQGYAGHLMHVHDRREREAATLAVMAALADMRDALEARVDQWPVNGTWSEYGFRRPQRTDRARPRQPPPGTGREDRRLCVEATGRTWDRMRDRRHRASVAPGSRPGVAGRSK